MRRRATRLLRPRPPTTTPRMHWARRPCRALFEPANRSLHRARRASFKFEEEARGRDIAAARGEGIWLGSGWGPWGPLAPSFGTTVRTWPLRGQTTVCTVRPESWEFRCPHPGRSGPSRIGVAPELPAWRRAASGGASRRVSSCMSVGLWLPFSLNWPQPPARSVPVRAAATHAAGSHSGDGGTGGLGSEICSPLSPSSLQ